MKLKVENFQFTIPDHTARFIKVSAEKPHGLGMMPELNLNALLQGRKQDALYPQAQPFTIYTIMPIQKPHDPEAVPNPPGFSKYGTLTPEQKWVYLNWLTNVQCLIHINYLLIYQTGVETELMNSGSLEAATEIFNLCQVQGPKYHLYAKLSLLFAAIKSNNPAIVKLADQTINKEYLEDFELYALTRFFEKIPLNYVFEIASRTWKLDRKFYKAEPELFRQVLAEVLTERFGEFSIPTKFIMSLDTFQEGKTFITVNFELPITTRETSYLLFTRSQKFNDEFGKIFDEVNRRIKLLLKSKTKTKSP